MRRLVRASSAGSNDGTGSGRGRFRRAFAAIAGTSSLVLLVAPAASGVMKQTLFGRDRGPGLRRSMLRGIATSVGGLGALFSLPVILALAVVAAVVAPAATAAAGLPEGRVYERVSSPDKRLGDVQAGVVSSDDGNTVVFASAAAGDDAHGAQAAVYALARRTGDGWQRQSAAAASLGNRDDESGANNATNLLTFSSDFSRSIYYAPFPLDSNDADEGGADLFRVNVDSGQGTLVSRDEQLPDAGAPNVFYFVGADEMLTRVYFQARFRALKSGAPPSAIYEWREDGSVRVASVLPDGTPVNGVALRAADVPGGSAGPGGVTRPHGGSHAVSDDGSRFFFNVGGADGVGEGGPLYMREGNVTVPISASQRTGSVGTVQGGYFLWAAGDGDTVFFVSSQPLTNGAPGVGAGLYRYRVSTGTLDLLSSGVDIGMLPLVSDDGSHVYFTSTAALAPGGLGGQMNAYVWTEGAGVEFIAVINEASRPARVSRNGRFALYESYDSLRGAPNGGHLAVYRYDAQTKDLDCVSCRPDGTPSQGDATLDRIGVFMLPDPGIASRSRNVSDNGQVFFSSNDQIVSGDHNAVFDVYAYGDGVGPYLLTSGGGSHDSFVADSSDDGNNVFFTTRDALVPEDNDGGTADLYDARIGGGGFPEPQLPAVPCLGEDCQGPPSPPPALPNMGSSHFGGYGNVRLVPDPVRASVGVSKLKAVTGSAATLTVRVPEAGRISVAGSSIQRKSVSASKAGSYSVPIALSPRAKQLLKEKKTLKVGVRVSYRAKDGQSASKSVSVTFKQPKAKRAKTKKGGR